MIETASLYNRLGGHAGILALMKTFYADARRHAVLGPIFNSQIQDWPVHLEKIAEFWALQTGGASCYRGGFGAAHLPLGLQHEHFEQWLGLWELNNARHLASPEAAEMSALARQLGARLSKLVQGRSALSIQDERSLPHR